MLLPSSKLSLSQLKSTHPAPAGISAEELAGIANKNPGFLENLQKQRGQDIELARSSFEKMLGRKLSDEDFEAKLNDPYFTSRRQAIEEVKKAQKIKTGRTQYQLAKSQAEGRGF